MSKKRKEIYGIEVAPSQDSVIQCKDEYDSDDYADSDLHSEVDGNDTSDGEMSFDEDIVGEAGNACIVLITTISCELFFGIFRQTRPTGWKSRRGRWRGELVRRRRGRGRWRGGRG